MKESIHPAKCLSSGASKRVVDTATLVLAFGPCTSAIALASLALQPTGKADQPQRAISAARTRAAARARIGAALLRRRGIGCRFARRRRVAGCLRRHRLTLGPAAHRCWRGGRLRGRNAEPRRRREVETTAQVPGRIAGRKGRNAPRRQPEVAQAELDRARMREKVAIHCPAPVRTQSPARRCSRRGWWWSMRNRWSYSFSTRSEPPHAGR